MIERPETIGEVSLNEPGRPSPGVGHFAQCGVASPAGTIPVGVAGEPGLVVRLQQQADYFADQLVRPRGQSQRSPFPVAFPDVETDAWDGPIALVAEGRDEAHR